MISIISFLILTSSLACFITSLIVPSVVLTCVGGIFLLYVAVLIHETGHVVGCLIRGNQIISVNIFPLKIENGKLYFLKKLKCSVVFKTGNDDRLIYFLGILFSFIEFCAVLPFLIIYTTALTIVLAVVTFGSFLGAMALSKKSDLYKVLNNNKIGE